MAPVERRENKFVRKLLKMYNKGANINELYTLACDNSTVVQRVDYEQYYKGAQYLIINTIHHTLKLTFTNRP